MVIHKLKLNNDKTEYVYLVSSQSGGDIDVEPITIEESSIQPAPSASHPISGSEIFAESDHIQHLLPLAKS